MHVGYSITPHFKNLENHMLNEIKYTCTSVGILNGLKTLILGLAKTCLEFMLGLATRKRSFCRQVDFYSS